MKRLLVLLGGIAIALLLRKVPMFGIDPAAAELGGSSMSVGLLGITPFISACLFVEVGAAAIHWIRGRGNEPRIRGKNWWGSLMVMTILLASVQSAGVFFYLQSLAEKGAFAPVPAIAPISVVVASLGLVALAFWMTHYGVGHGVATLMLLALVMELDLSAVRQQSSTGEFSNFALLAGLVFIGVLTAVLVVLLRPRRLQIAEGTEMRVAGSPIGWVPLISALSVPSLLALTSPDMDSLHVALCTLGEMLLVAVVYLSLTWRPGQRAAMLVRGGHISATEESAAATALRRYAWRRSGLAIVVLAGCLGLALLQGSEPVMFSAVLATLVLGAMDLKHEVDLRTQQGELASVASGHDFERVALLTDALAAQGIQSVVRNERLRAAVTFMGPHLPLEVFVTAKDADASRAVIARIDPGLGHGGGDSTPEQEAPEA